MTPIYVVLPLDSCLSGSFGRCHSVLELNEKNGTAVRDNINRMHSWESSDSVRWVQSWSWALLKGYAS